MKKTISIILAILLAFCSLPMTVFAADDQPAQTEQKVTEFTGTPDMSGYTGRINPTRYNEYEYDFTFSTTYQDTTRAYNSTYLMIMVKITDINGGTPGNEVAIDFKDPSGTYVHTTAYADGAWYGEQFPIYIGMNYYLYFENLGNTSTPLKVEVYIVG